MNQRSADPNTGPSAVIRNLEAVLPSPQDNVYHLVVTDRFYTSVQLAFQLLHRNVYSIGTITGDKLGYPVEIVEKNRDRPKRIEHGAVRMAFDDWAGLVGPEARSVPWNWIQQNDGNVQETYKGYARKATCDTLPIHGEGLSSLDGWG
ncbi:Hypothetical protein PHPALM_2890 [Phytophthora palmivora]|uniref:PiggyBac transposable element-derived protein domain-containing protein n=1 Tax=Phytophthora palmivora TaxID=4796 RepID=A0A2P4YNS9_9STRA|nr:Hypothetical protein PHPALM_2890 [Phytophthora palmivora]